MASDLIKGEIPDHWEFTTLGEVCRRGGGNIQTGPFGSQLHASDYVTVGVPSIMPTNIGENQIVEDGIVRITENDANRLGQHRLQAGDIVYSRRGDVEKRALIREREVGWLCGTGCLKVRLGSGVVDPLFASMFLGHPAIKEWIVRHAVGATMPNLNTSIMSAVPFALPPLAEQKAIAAVLGALDDKIELNRRMNATLEAMAQALFQSWFADFDPVRANLDRVRPAGVDKATGSLFPIHLEDSPLGKVPAGWCVLRYADVLTPHSARVGEDSVPEFSATVTGLSSRHERFKKQLSKSQSKNKRIVGGDLVFGFSREVINFGLMREPVGAVSPVYEVFKIDASKIEPDLLERHFRFNMPYYMDILKPGAREGKPIDRDYLLRKHVLVPDIVIQRAFLATIKPWSDKIKANESESRTLAALRDTLLPKLLSGEVSVNRSERNSSTHL